MGNLWLNIRFGPYHLQCDNGYLFRWTWSENRHWAGRWMIEKSWFAIYDFRPIQAVQEFWHRHFKKE